MSHPALAETRSSEPPRPEDAWARSEEWLLTQRVVASPRFSRSAFLTQFLLYICERKLHSREHEITEHQIGVNALGRASAYNPGEDNIVRNYARILRRRLQEHFDAEGRDEPLRITVPTGSYVPVFEANVAAVPDLRGHLQQSEPEPQIERRMELPIEPAASGSYASFTSFRQGWQLRATGALVLLGLLLGVAFHRWQRDAAAALYDRFWTEVFDPQQTTFVVTGDSGFAMLQDITGRDIHLHDYASQGSAESFPGFDIPSVANQVFGADRFSNYTSAADLGIVMSLSQLPAFRKAHTHVLYARDLRMADLKHSNAILLGGPHANPWVELFDSESQFRMVFPARNGIRTQSVKTILNLHPKQGEQADYPLGENSESRETYTLLSFLPGADHVSHALLLEGQDMAGTQAAADFVMDRSAMAPILQRAVAPDGTIGPFQILLKTRAVGANAPQAQVVVQRYDLP